VEGEGREEEKELLTPFLFRGVKWMGEGWGSKIRGERKRKEKRGGRRDGMEKWIVKALDNEYKWERVRKSYYTSFGRGVDRDGIGRLR
jgi:hypothetical protein